MTQGVTPFPFLTGTLARAGSGLVPPEAPGFRIPLSSLLAPGAVHRLLDKLLAHRPGQDLRALLSLWSRYYFYALIPPVVMTSLLAHRDLPLRPEDGAVLLNEQGLPSAIVLPHAGALSPAPEDPFTRFAPLVRGHLAPLITHWAAEAKLAPRVLWANAAGYFAWAVREAESAGEAACGAADPGHAIVAATCWPDGQANPLHEPMRVTDGADGPQRIRKVCCLLYRLPDSRECSHCPLLQRGAKAGCSATPSLATA